MMPKLNAISFSDSLVISFADFRDKRELSGEALQKALWLGEMELRRLETWIPTSKQMADGGDFDLKL